MNPLQLELDRLYGLGASLAEGGVRVLVLELALPARWQQLSTVWTGVQTDLELPAPAIALSGSDGLQLWFSFATPISPEVGERFLQSLRARYLADVRPAQVRMTTEAARLPAAPPPVEAAADRWSAFVAPDLASVFADTPWLDLPPGIDGQATLLRALAPISEADFENALRLLGEAEALASRAAAASRQARQPGDAGDAANADRARSGEPGRLSAAPSGSPGSGDALRFLRSVMQDAAAPLALRIEAAKALLPWQDGS